MRRVVHLARPLPIPREVLVVEDRDGAPARFEHLDDLTEEFVTWVLHLALFVTRVFAVLAYQHDAIDRELTAAQGERFRDGREAPGFGMTLESFAAPVAVVDLVDEERDEVHRRTVVRAVPAVAFKEAVHDMLTVGHLEVGGAD